MCACSKKKKRRGINLFQKTGYSVLFRVGISMYKSIILSIPYTNTASDIDTTSISGSKIIGRALSEQEDTTKISSDFVTQIILNLSLIHI